MIVESNFKSSLNNAFEKIAELPTGEIKYYLFILANSIKKENSDKTRLFLNELLLFINELENLYAIEHEEDVDEQYPDLTKLHLLCLHYCNLKHIAQTHSFCATVITCLINVGAVLTAIITGILGALIGAVIGLVRGSCNLNPISGFFIGGIIGAFLGGMFGFRAPKKLLQNELQRQLKFGLNGLENTLDNLMQNPPLFFSPNKINHFKVYLNEVENELKLKFDTTSEYQQFLEDEQCFEINTYHASFIGNPMLHKYLGHHAYIKLEIKDNPYLIEFTPEPSDPLEIPVQKETRKVTGAKLVEMLAYHRKLQETNAASLPFVLSKMKPGDKDCFSYINKILIGTSQNATVLKRFVDMNSVGNYIGSWIENLSPFKPDFFNDGFEMGAETSLSI